MYVLVCVCAEGGLLHPCRSEDTSLWLENPTKGSDVAWSVSALNKIDRHKKSGQTREPPLMGLGVCVCVYIQKRFSHCTVWVLARAPLSDVPGAVWAAFLSDKQRPKASRPRRRPSQRSACQPLPALLLWRSLQLRERHPIFISTADCTAPLPGARLKRSQCGAEIFFPRKGLFCIQ